VREDCGDGGHSVLQAVEFGRGFPFGVLGPVDLWALRRFASICFWLAIWVAPSPLNAKKALYAPCLGGSRHLSLE
jgi:hypothetical protein